GYGVGLLKMLLGCWRSGGYRSCSGRSGRGGGGLVQHIGIRIVCRQQELCVESLIGTLLIELVDLKVSDRHNSRQAGHLLVERSQIVEVSVNFDLDRLGLDRILRRIVAR